MYGIHKQVSKQKILKLLSYSFENLRSKINYLLWKTYLAGCNAYKATEDVTEDLGIIRCDDIDHIHTIRPERSLALVNGRCKNRQFEE
jgi:hypothetical protein